MENKSGDKGIGEQGMGKWRIKVGMGEWRTRAGIGGL